MKNVHPRDRLAPEGTVFTPDQIEDFKVFHAQAQETELRRHVNTSPLSSGLFQDRHDFVLANYAALRSQALGVDHRGLEPWHEHHGKD